MESGPEGIFLRSLKLSLPSQTQCCSSRGQNGFKGRAVVPMEFWNLMPRAVSNFCSTQSCTALPGHPRCGQQWVQFLLHRIQAVNSGGIHMSLTLQACRLHELWSHGYLHLDFKRLSPVPGKKLPSGGATSESILGKCLVELCDWSYH